MHLLQGQMWNTNLGVIAFPSLFQDLGHYKQSTTVSHIVFIFVKSSFNFLLYTALQKYEQSDRTPPQNVCSYFISEIWQYLAFASVHPGHCIITCAVAKQTHVKQIVFTLKNNVITERLRRSRTEYSISHCYDRPCVLKPSKSNRRPPEWYA